MRREYPEAPIVAVGLIVRRGDRVLIAQRGQEPSRGRWSIPGGGVHVGETLREAGRREVREECGLDVTVGEVAEVFESIVPDAAGKTRFHYVIIDFLADYAGGDLKAGSDIQDARWVTRDDLPSYDITERAREVLTRVLSKR